MKGIKRIFSFDKKLISILIILILFIQFFSISLLLSSQISGLKTEVKEDINLNGSQTSMQVGGEYITYDHDINTGDFLDWVTTPAKYISWSTYENMFGVVTVRDQTLQWGSTYYNNHEDRMRFFSDNYPVSTLGSTTIRSISTKNIIDIGATQLTDWSYSFQIAWDEAGNAVWPRKLWLSFTVHFTDETFVKTYTDFNYVVIGDSGGIDQPPFTSDIIDVSYNIPTLIEDQLGEDPETKVIDYFRITATTYGLKFWISLFESKLEGYKPIVKNWLIKDEVIGAENQYFYSEMTGHNTGNPNEALAGFRDQEVQFRFIETGAVLGENLEQDWTDPIRFSTFYDFTDERLGFYGYKYVAQNEWGFKTESPEYEFLLSKTTFPKTSYLNIRAFEFRDIPEELFYIYLGESETLTLFDFKEEGIGLGNWESFGNSNFTYGFERILFNGINGGIKSDFSHIQVGQQYDIENVSLQFDIKTDFSELVLIVNPTIYDYDYLLNINEEYLGEWVTVIIPFYFFQNFPSANSYIGELGFFSFLGGYQISNIRLTTESFNYFEIDYIAEEYEIDDYEILDEIKSIEYPLIDNQTYSSIPIWDNYSSTIQYLLNVNQNTQDEYQYNRNDDEIASVTDNWFNYTDTISQSYNLTAETNNQTLNLTSSEVYGSNTVWDNYTNLIEQQVNLLPNSELITETSTINELDLFPYFWDNSTIQIVETGNLTAEIINQSHIQDQTFNSAEIWENFSLSLTETNFNVSNSQSQNMIISQNQTLRVNESYGNYYGIYPFDSDSEGSNPTDWIVDETVDIIDYPAFDSPTNSHYKTIRLSDQSSGDLALISQSISEQIEGSIEFWFAGVTATNNDYVYLQIEDQSNGFGGIYIEFELDSTGITIHYDSTSSLYNIGEWIHFKLDFDCVTDTYDLYVNTQQIASNIAFTEASIDLDFIAFFTDTPDQGYLFYLDSIDYSWININGIPYFDFRSYNTTVFPNSQYTSKVYDLGIADNHYIENISTNIYYGNNFYDNLNFEYRFSQDNISWGSWEFPQQFQDETNITNIFPQSYSHNASNENIGIGFEWDNLQSIEFYDITTASFQEEAHITFNFNLSHLSNIDTYYLNIEWVTGYTPIYPETVIPKLYIYNWQFQNYELLHSAYNNLGQTPFKIINYNGSFREYINYNGIVTAKLTTGWGNHTLYPSPNGYYDLLLYKADITAESLFPAIIDDYRDRYFQFRFIPSLNFVWDTPEIYDLTIFYQIENLTGHIFNNTANYTMLYPYIQKENIYNINLTVTSSIQDNITLEFYNYSSLKFENVTENPQNLINFSLSKDYFNGTHFQFHLNSSISPIAFNIDLSINITSYYYQNLSLIFNYNLGLSTYHFLVNSSIFYIFQNQTSNQFNITYRKSTNNINWDEWRNLNPEYLNQYLQIRIDLNTTNKWYSPIFINFSIFIGIYNVTEWRIDEILNFNFSPRDNEIISIEYSDYLNLSARYLNFYNFINQTWLEEDPQTEDYIGNIGLGFSYEKNLTTGNFNSTNILLHIACYYNDPFGNNTGLLNPLLTINFTSEIKITYKVYQNTSYSFYLDTHSTFQTPLYFTSNYSIYNQYYNINGTLIDDFNNFWGIPYENENFDVLFSPLQENSYVLCDSTGDTLIGSEINKTFFFGKDIIGEKFGVISKIENISDELIIMALWYPDLNLVIGFSSTISPLLQLAGISNITDIFPAVNIGFPPTNTLYAKNSTVNPNVFDWNFYSFEISNVWNNGTHNLSSIDYYINGQFDNTITIPYNLSEYNYNLVLQESVWGSNHSVLRFDSVFNLNSHNVSAPYILPADSNLYLRSSPDNSSWGEWIELDYTQNLNIQELGERYIEYKIDLITYDQASYAEFRDFRINFQYNNKSLETVKTGELFYNYSHTPKTNIQSIEFNLNVNKTPFEIGFYNHSSGLYEFSSYSNPEIQLNLTSNYYNETTILYQINVTNSPPAYFVNITSNITMKYFIYQNTSYSFYYELPKNTPTVYYDLQRIGLDYDLGYDTLLNGTPVDNFNDDFLNITTGSLFNPINRRSLWTGQIGFIDEYSQINQINQYLPIEENGYVSMYGKGMGLISKFSFYSSNPVNYWEIGKKWGVIAKAETFTEDYFIFQLTHIDFGILPSLSIGFIVSEVGGNPVISYNIVRDLQNIRGLFYWDQQFSTIPFNPLDWNMYSLSILNDSAIAFYVNGIYDKTLVAPFNITALAYNQIENNPRINLALNTYDQTLFTYDWNIPPAEYLIDSFWDLDSHNSYYYPYIPTDFSLYVRSSTDNSSWGAWEEYSFSKPLPSNTPINQFYQFRIDFNTTNPFYIPTLNEIDLDIYFQEFTPFGFDKIYNYTFSKIDKEEIYNISYKHFINHYVSDETIYPLYYTHNGTVIGGASSDLSDRNTDIHFEDISFYGKPVDSEAPQTIIHFYFNASKLRLAERFFIDVKAIGWNFHWFGTGDYRGIFSSINIVNQQTNSTELLWRSDPLFQQHFDSGLIEVTEVDKYINSTGFIDIMFEAGVGYDGLFNLDDTIRSEIEIYYLAIIPEFIYQFGFYNFETELFEYNIFDTLKFETLLPIKYFNGTHIYTNMIFISPNYAFVINHTGEINITYYTYQNTTYDLYDKLNSTYIFYEDITYLASLEEETEITFKVRFSQDNVSWGAWITNLNIFQYQPNYIHYQIELNSINNTNNVSLSEINLNLIYENLTHYNIEFFANTQIDDLFFLYKDHFLNLEIDPIIPAENIIDSSIAIFNFENIDEFGNIRVNSQEFINPKPETDTIEILGELTINVDDGQSNLWFNEYIDSNPPYYSSQFFLDFSYLQVSGLNYFDIYYDILCPNAWNDNGDLFIYNWQTESWDIITADIGMAWRTGVFRVTDLDSYRSEEFTVKLRLHSGFEIVGFSEPTYIYHSSIRIDQLIIKPDIPLFPITEFKEFDNELSLDLARHNDSNGDILIKYEIETLNPITITVNSNIILNYNDIILIKNVTFDIDLNDLNEISFWYDFEGSTSRLEILSYNNTAEKWVTLGILNETPLNFAYMGVLSTRFSQKWLNVTNLDNFSQIQFKFYIINSLDISETNTFRLKRFETIQYTYYKLESDVNRQRYDILIFERNRETLLIIDFAGREVYRKEVVYAEFIDIFMNIGEITLKNYENYTVWFAFESRGVTIEYAVPANSEREVILLLGDYFVKIYDDEFTVLRIREVSITTTNKTTFQIGIPTSVVIPDIPPDRNLWQLFAEAFSLLWVWFTTDTYGMLTFGILIFLIGLYIYRWYRGRQKEETEKIKEARKKAYQKGLRDAMKGKGLPRKKIKF